MLKLLIEHGADVNVQDSFGDTPLIRLSRREALRVNPDDEEMHLSEDVYKCFQLLIENGADVSIQNNDGMTALDYIQMDLNLVSEKEDKDTMKKVYKMVKAQKR